MLKHILKFTAVLVLGVLSTIAHATLIYQFDTTLELVSGLDSNNLNGAEMSFQAIIADDAIYRNLNGSPFVSAISSQWTIFNSNIDGIYVPRGVGWIGSYNGNRNAGWFRGGGFMDGVADLDFVAIFHHAVKEINIGDLVKASDFGPIITGTQDVFRSSDSSMYNWQNNASFSISRAVPEPSILLLLIIGLTGLFLVNGRSQWKRL